MIHDDCDITAVSFGFFISLLYARELTLNPIASYNHGYSEELMHETI